MKTYQWISLIALVVVLSGITFGLAMLRSYRFQVHMATAAYGDSSSGQSWLSRLFGDKEEPAPMVMIGDTREMVVAKLGPPEGEAEKGETTTLFYVGGGVDLVKDEVVKIQNGFELQAQARTAARQYEERMRAAGYEMFDGRWVHADSARSMRTSRKSQRARQYNRIMDQKRTSARRTLRTTTSPKTTSVASTRPKNSSGTCWCGRALSFNSRTCTHGRRSVHVVTAPDTTVALPQR